MRQLFALLAFVAVCQAIDLFGRDQSCAVRGKLICNGQPAAGVLVKLWDEDDSMFMEF